MTPRGKHGTFDSDLTSDIPRNPSLLPSRLLLWSLAASKHYLFWGSIIIFMQSTEWVLVIYM